MLWAYSKNIQRTCSLTSAKSKAEIKMRRLLCVCICISVCLWVCLGGDQLFHASSSEDFNLYHTQTDKPSSFVLYIVCIALIDIVIDFNIYWQCNACAGWLAPSREMCCIILDIFVFCNVVFRCWEKRQRERERVERERKRDRQRRKTELKTEQHTREVAYK